MTISDADAAFILGKGGKTKEKIARVSKERGPPWPTRYWHAPASWWFVDGLVVVGWV
jgi:hypothetical protein